VSSTLYLVTLLKFTNCTITFIGRADVDKAINTIPEALRGEVAAADKSKNGQVEDSGKKDNDSEKSAAESSGSGDEMEVPAKKSKIEGE